MNLRHLSVAMIGSSLLINSAARASLTSVLDNSNETTISEILANVYGGEFAQDGNDLSNGTVSAVRVDDSQDQVWEAQPYIATLVSQNSAATQEFGTYNQAGEFQSFITAQGIGSVESVPSAIYLSPGYTWGHSGTLGTQSAIDDVNSDQRDHLVTYQIKGTEADNKVWMLFWEDLDVTPATTPGRSANDFNDMVLTLQAAPVGAGPVSVPLPPAAISGAITAMGVGITVLMRRRKA